jgi:hypothetical protein
MAKRKKATSRKKSTRRKGSGVRSRARSGRVAVADAPAPEPVEGSARLGPAPALPASGIAPAQPAPRLGEHDGEHAGSALNALLADVSAAPAPPPPVRVEEALTQAQIYERLAALLVPYAMEMESEMHPRIGYCLKARSRKTGREVHFGAVQALPDGVVYHLFPLYGHPELLSGASPELFTRMRGQTCFHFAEIESVTLAELATLTRRGFECFLADGMA